MFEIIDTLIAATVRHHLVMNEEDVTRVLLVIQAAHHDHIPNMKVGNCGWADKQKWFIHFDTTKRKWDRIVRELNVVRVFGNVDIPKNTIGVYTTD